MKEYIDKDEWKIIENGFHPSHNRITESLCSLGNGFFGQRGSFEERYTGDSLQGNYISGIYYPDKTIVGWWKNGYPEYFAKVLNAANWIGIDIWVGKTLVDLATVEIINFKRILDMQCGTLTRMSHIKLKNGIELKIEATRFCSIVTKELGFLNYSLELLNSDSLVRIRPYLDFDVSNADANYGDKFWIEKYKSVTDKGGNITAETKKTAFSVSANFKCSINTEAEIVGKQKTIERDKYIAHEYTVDAKASVPILVQKAVIQMTSFHHPGKAIEKEGKALLEQQFELGFDSCLMQHTTAWKNKWEEIDIRIQGDIAAQQGIRFNIFHLHQTYSGENPALNIGPKGFTGEKYGGSTYWDTEAYCIPFYLSTSDSSVAKNLLKYRYAHLDKAIENASKLGFKDGAALYPMVTMNGEECHNEWEITFEEIHRNGAIAYAIFDYIRYTGDKNYLVEGGLEVLLAIARFWAQRVNWSAEKEMYVILGVTGPNEYENNVNNNWYTNYIAKWCMTYCISCIKECQTEKIFMDGFIIKTKFSEDELSNWDSISSQMYLPENVTRNIFLQQDGFLDKEIVKAKDLDPSETPINQHWSWDRILRSSCIKQADVLQGLYFFEDEFNQDTLKSNFDFYEPLTVHESSLSPCVHSILASSLGYTDKAYEMYLRTARLDLDDYNNDTEDGLHITSMAGTWMSIVKGFGGMRVKNGTLHFKPTLPATWDSYSFKVIFRKFSLQLAMDKKQTTIDNNSDQNILLRVFSNDYNIAANSSIVIANFN